MINSSLNSDCNNANTIIINGNNANLSSLSYSNSSSSASAAESISPTSSIKSNESNNVIRNESFINAASKLLEKVKLQQHQQQPTMNTTTSQMEENSKNHCGNSIKRLTIMSTSDETDHIPNGNHITSIRML